VNLTDHDLKQISESTLSRLTHEQLIGFTLRLLSDLRDTRRQLNIKPDKPSRNQNQSSNEPLPTKHAGKYFHSDEDCRNYLGYLRSNFKEHLSRNLSARTVNRQVAIVSLLIDFLCFDCDLKKSNCPGTPASLTQTGVWQ